MIFEAGARLGPYEVLDLLGAGGMGEFYRPRDTRLDRTIAIKVLSPTLANDQEFRLRFEREARLASALDHPHICTIFDVGHEHDVAYLVMQNLRGETLAARLVQGALPVDAALEYGIQIASALAAAHSAGILHRDLKPANVMVTDGSVKILDFGLAKSTAATPGGASTETGAVGLSGATLTRAGVIMGTAAYMSPEQVEARHVDARSDLFSFGALLYEMLTGRRAFSGDSTLTTAFAVMNDSPPPARQIRPEIPADLDEIIRRCLEKNPGDRYESAAVLHNALRACQARLTVSPSDRRATLRRRVLAVAAGVVVVLAAGSLVWTARQHARVRDAIDRSLPEMARLSEQGEYAAAFRLALDAERHISGDRRLAELWREISLTVSVETEPPDAEIRIKEYAEPDATWQVLGRSPLKGLRISRGLKRWHITKPQYQSVDAARAPEEAPSLEFVLDRERSIPPGMVRVTAGPVRLGLTGLEHLQPAPVEDFSSTGTR
jgi:serine/threonine protein kinase